MASRQWCQKVPISPRSAATKPRFGALAFTVSPLRVFELLNDVQDHLPLASRQVQALVCDRADRLVLEDTHCLFIEQGGFPRRIEEIRRVHAEDICQSNHLTHGRIGELP